MKTTRYDATDAEAASILRIGEATHVTGPGGWEMMILPAEYVLELEAAVQDGSRVAPRARWIPEADR